MLDGGSDFQCKWGNFNSERGRPSTCSVVDRLKATQQRVKQHGVNADWGILDGDAHWCQLANTTQPSMCNGDAALCQITLTMFRHGNANELSDYLFYTRS